jgi:hypothetical protein
MFRWLLSWFSDEALTSELENRDVEPLDVFTVPQCLSHLSGSALVQACEERGIERYQEPIEELEQLPDEPGRVYVWHVDSEDKRQGWLQTLSQHERDYGALDALHIVITDKEEMFQMEQEELAGYV